MLTQERVRELFDYAAETGSLIRKTAITRSGVKVGDTAGYTEDSGYLRISVDGKNYRAHRLAWLWNHGELPARLDHIDRDPSNNRIENLRPCTQSQNLSNSTKRSGGSSRWKGVYWHKCSNKWMARIQVNGKTKYLGIFATEADAAQAYNLAAHETFGEFANLNDHPANREVA